MGVGAGLLQAAVAADNAPAVPPAPGQQAPPGHQGMPGPQAVPAPKAPAAPTLPPGFKDQKEQMRRVLGRPDGVQTLEYVAPEVPKLISEMTEAGPRSDGGP